MTDPINRPVPEDHLYADAPVRMPPPKSKKAKRLELAQAKRDREARDLAAMLNTEAGQAFVMWLLAECHVYTNVFNPTDAPATSAAFADGQRSIGLKVLARIQNHDPEFYPKMLLHHLKRKQQETAAEAALLDRV